MRREEPFCQPFSARCCRHRAVNRWCCARTFSRTVWCSIRKAYGMSRWTRQKIFRQFVSEVEMTALDGNGRFLIPKRYLQMAGIQQNIKFIGMGDTIEIWANEKVEESKMDGEEFGQALESIMTQDSAPGETY